MCVYTCPPILIVFLCSTILLGATLANPIETAKQKPWRAVDTGKFADAIHHARMKYKDDKTPYPRYRADQIVHIAENLRAWQNGDGGWPKNVDWLRQLTEEEMKKLPNGQPGRMGRRSTLDNRTSWSQIEYLAHVFKQTKLEPYADSARKGVDYLLREQRESGGWRGADVDAITFNDDVMVGTMRTLRAVASDVQLYAFIDGAIRKRATAAHEKALQCTLKCQIKVNGRLTAWCQQHDHETFQPVWARSYELPSITAGESANVVRLLMEIEHPTPEIIRAVDSAVAWFDKVKIIGLRIDKVAAPPVKFRHHFCEFDRVEVKDAHARPIWTRYYDLQEEQPVFCTRAGKITRKFTDLSRERRTGYAFYGYWPEKLLINEYPKWKESLRSQH